VFVSDVWFLIRILEADEDGDQHIVMIITPIDVDWYKEPVNTPFASLITHQAYVMRTCS
jgi:hypothetical protein